MSFADGICGHASYKKTKTSCVTIKLNTEFISAARPGEWLEGFAEVTSVKANFVYCNCRLYVGNRDVLLVNSIFKLRTNKNQKKLLKKRR